MNGNQTPTAHEMMCLQELIRLETMELQKAQAILPVIGDAELKEHLAGCVQTGTTHLKALVDFCQKQQLA